MTLTEKLKVETQETHNQLGKDSIFHLLLSDTLSKSVYIEILTIWFGIYQQFETQLKKSEVIKTIIPDIEERMKSQLISNDLKNLKSAKSSTYFEFISTTQLETLIGYLYVLEGSTLGSLFIVKKLQTHSFITQENIHFYSHYKSETQNMWSKLKTNIDGWGEKNKESYPKIIEASIECFRKLQDIILTNKVD